MIVHQPEVFGKGSLKEYHIFPEMSISKPNQPAIEVFQLAEKDSQGRIYQFKPRKSPKLKTVNYVSPEKKRLLKEREQAQKDKKTFFIGAGILLIIIAFLTFLRVR